jgi:hypothetical protein
MTGGNRDVTRLIGQSPLVSEQAQLANRRTDLSGLLPEGALKLPRTSGKPIRSYDSAR